MNIKISVGLEATGFVLALVFIVLKCMGIVSWPWWAVFIPILGSLALTFIVLLIMMIFTLKLLEKR